MTLVQPITIAVIEDDKSLSDMYRFKLENSGYDVRTAYNGHEGLAVIEASAPDLVLLDLRMPIMSGDEMLAKMRATEWGNSIKVIILTNISKDEAPMSLRFLRVDRYVVKAHHTPTQILEIVREVLR